MRRIWSIELIEVEASVRAYQVKIINEEGHYVVGDGRTPSGAYQNAENKLVIKPAFWEDMNV